jgi:hypothetical protein
MGSERRKDTDTWDRLAAIEDGFSGKGTAAEAHRPFPRAPVPSGMKVSAYPVTT